MFVASENDLSLIESLAFLNCQHKLLKVMLIEPKALQMTFLCATNYTQYKVKAQTSKGSSKTNIWEFISELILVRLAIIDNAKFCSQSLEA